MKLTILSVQERPYARKNTGKTYENGRPIYAKCDASDPSAELGVLVLITLSNGKSIVRNPTAFQQDCQAATLSCSSTAAYRNLVGCEIDVTGLKEDDVMDKEGNVTGQSYNTIDMNGNLHITLSDRVIDKLDSGAIKESTNSWELEVMERFANRKANEETAERISTIRSTFYAGVKPTMVANDVVASGKISDKAKAILEEAAK